MRRKQISRAQEVLNSNSKVETIAISKDKQRFPRREGFPEQGQYLTEQWKTLLTLVRQALSAHTHGAYQTPCSPSSPAATALRVAQSLHRDIKGTKAGETREVSVLGAPLPLSQLSPLLTPGYGSDPSEPTPPDPGCGSRHIPTMETK